MKNKKFTSTLTTGLALQAISAGMAGGQYSIGAVSNGTISAAFVEDRRAARASTALALGPLGLLAKSEKSHPVTIVVTADGDGSRIVVASDHSGAFAGIAKALTSGEREFAKSQKAQARSTAGGFVDRMNAMVAQAKVLDAAKREGATGSILESPAAPSGWHPDPTGRHEARFWDGRGWTEHVTDGGAPATDPLG